MYRPATKGEIKEAKKGYRYLTKWSKVLIPFIVFSCVMTFIFQGFATFTAGEHANPYEVYNMRIIFATVECVLAPGIFLILGLIEIMDAEGKACIANGLKSFYKKAPYPGPEGYWRWYVNEDKLERIVDLNNHKDERHGV